MFFRAWVFGFVGVVLITGGLLWYEVRKSEVPALHANGFNIFTDPPSKASKSLSDSIASLSSFVIELEKFRLFAVGSGIMFLLLSWRNSAGYTAERRHEELLEALIELAPPCQPTGPSGTLRAYRSVKDRESS